MLAVQNEAEWARLCGDVLGVPDMLDGRFAGNQRRMEHREEVSSAWPRPWRGCQPAT